MNDLHKAGLGILKLLTNVAEKDLGCEIWNDLEPHATSFVQEIIPSGLEIHPICGIGYKIFDAYVSRREKTLKAQAQAKLAEENKVKLLEIGERNVW